MEDTIILKQEVTAEKKPSSGCNFDQSESGHGVLVLSRLLVATSHVCIPAAAFLISWLVPAACWYRVSLVLSSAMARAGGVRGNGGPWNNSILHAQLLARLLSLLTRAGRPFPIRTTATGLNVLSESRNPNGVVLCSVHLPLTRVAVKTIINSGYPLKAALAADPRPEESIRIPGSADRLAALKVLPVGLVKARTALRNGGWIAALIDSGDSDVRYCRNLLRFTARVGARAVFFFSELQADGCIEVRFVCPPDPWCSTESGIERNIEALNGEVQQILKRSWSSADFGRYQI
jgi:hypothetical protein